VWRTFLSAALLKASAIRALKGRGFEPRRSSFSARLKPCPFKTSEAEEFFRSHWEAVPFQGCEAPAFFSPAVEALLHLKPGFCVPF